MAIHLQQISVEPTGSSGTVMTFSKGVRFLYCSPFPHIDQSMDMGSPHMEEDMILCASAIQRATQLGDISHSTTLLMQLTKEVPES